MTSQFFSIRELTEEDLQEYKKIRLEMLAHHPKNFGSSKEEEEAFPLEHFLKRLKKAHAKTVGAFLGEEMVGLLTLMMNPRKKMKHIGTINSFYVREPYRRKGIAKTLLHHIETLALKEGIIRLNLVVMEKNTNAYHFYRNEGYIETGKDLDAIHYEGHYYTLISMSKQIGEKHEL